LTGAKHPTLGVGVYTPDLAARLTTVPRSTLASWRASGLLTPGLELDLPRTHRAYTYDDLGAIFLIRELRGRGLSMQRLRKAAAWLKMQTASGALWANRRVWTDGRDLFLFERDAEPGEPLAATRYGQTGFSVFLPDVVEGLLAQAAPAFKDVSGYVEINPHIQAGQPVIHRTRLTTALVAGIAGSSVDVARVRDVYPQLTAEAIRAAVTFEIVLGRLAA
jgi:uncharacterized protein (DUF433 family)/DNA-binding transcriptional MerR regulator